MRVFTFSFAVFVAACSSGSSGSGDAGADVGQPDHHTKDAAHPRDAEHDAARDVEADAATVCSPLFGVDAGKRLDAEADARHRDAGTDGATEDGAADATSDTAPAPSIDASSAGDGGHDAGTDAPPPTCTQLCVAASPAAYKSFLKYQVKECGCVMDGACYGACHASTTLAPTSACGACVANQTAEGLGSECTLTAALDCANDTACTAYQSCAGACPM